MCARESMIGESSIHINDVAIEQGWSEQLPEIYVPLALR